jgi:uncharacterized protein YdiU (UPF0061 family)
MSKISELKIKNSFSGELPADPIEGSERRQVENACFSYVEPTKTSNPSLIHASSEMVKELEITNADSKEFLEIVTGNKSFPNFKPYAMCYGGHQFGNWAGQLGDGRAINIAEVEVNKKPWVLQLKGAGQTPYSRGADGFAVLRSSIREYLCSEAMFHLGVATTRALSLSLSGDSVVRDVLYNGNPAEEKGAIVCRVAPSFIRFGNFEIFASRGDHKTLKELVDYTINHFYAPLGSPSKETYLAFFKEVVHATKQMILDWQRVGFVHGVMNTDNLSILGLTIDYGPYGWLEDYNSDWTPNTTDAENRRYRYGNQPSIGMWNLTRLANAIYPLIEEAAPLEAILKEYQDGFRDEYLSMMLSKIGVFTVKDGDKKLINDLQVLLTKSEVDMTLFFRNLSQLELENPTEFTAQIVKDSYLTNDEIGSKMEEWKKWLSNYAERIALEGIPSAERIERMQAINPKYVLRNYMAQLAIDAADKGDYTLIDELYQLLKKPYDEQLEMQKWFAKRPDWANDKVGCSMLSCSS